MVAENCVLTGTVEFEQAFLSAAGAFARLLVEEVTRADAAATVVAQLDLPLTGTVARGTSLPFTLTVRNVDITKRYAVRVHVDRSGNGRIKAGDQISTQSYPVLTQGSRADAKVAVVPVED